MEGGTRPATVVTFQILSPAVAWVVLCSCAIASAHALRTLLDFLYPSISQRGGLLRLRLGPTLVRDVWSTIFVFVLVVPYLLLVLSMVLGFALALMEGWSLSDGFHYHLFMLGLTQVNLGEASPPDTIMGDLFNMVTTLTGGVSLLVILGMAGFTTSTKRFAERAPDGFLGLVRTVFIVYPLVILALAILIACAMCAIERWPPLDSFLMACGWFSNAPIKLASCQSTNERTTFLILICRMVAIAMKLTALQQIFANTFPRNVAQWIDWTLGNEHDWESKMVAKSDREELGALQERRQALEVENGRLHEERRQLQQLLRELGDLPDAEDEDLQEATSILSLGKARSCSEEEGAGILQKEDSLEGAAAQGLPVPVAAPASAPPRRRSLKRSPRAVVLRGLANFGIVPRMQKVVAKCPSDATPGRPGASSRTSSDATPGARSAREVNFAVATEASSATSGAEGQDSDDAAAAREEEASPVVDEATPD